MKEIMIAIVIAIITIKGVSAAHFIIGIVEDGADGELANGKTVLLWNQENGVNDNLTDTVGPTGNSGASNTYMIDCELLETPCQINDNISVRVINLDGYFSEALNVTITGSGFDIVDNITLNTPLNVTSVTVEDDNTNPQNEIDLIPASTKKITCTGIIEDLDNETEIKNASATFFDTTSSSYEEADDNNNHYTNTSCDINTAYGSQTEAETTCIMNIDYYANATSWNCTIEAYDIYNNSNRNSDITTINQLLALGVDSPINFGSIGTENLSEEKQVNITNYGNVAFNISLSAYGDTPGDNLSMSCTNSNISIEHQKFNLTASYDQAITLNQIQNNYTNLSAQTIIGELNLEHRKNDGLNEANKSTYWRMYAPTDLQGTCSGNTIFGAVIAPSS